MITYEELIKNLNVLLVDDDEDYLLVTYSYLKMRGYNVDKVTSAKEALEAMEKKTYQILLVDYFMPSMSGEELINEVRKTNKKIIIILQTGFSGQKPPIESMQKLNIQNYHDKTEGIDRLNLELISAVKIFNQQNEIALTKYRQEAIGSLMSGIANEIKNSLLGISAGIEYTNMVIEGSKNELITLDKISQINKFSQNNKTYLEKIDKILSAILNHINKSDSIDVIKDKDALDTIDLILKTDVRSKNINFVKKAILKSDTYLTGPINDSIFLICEIIRKVCKVSNDSETIELILTEDEFNWYFNISSDNIKNLDINDLYLIKNNVLSINNLNMIIEDNEIKFIINKNC